MLSTSVIHTSNARNAGRTRNYKGRGQSFTSTRAHHLFAVGYRALSQKPQPQSNPHFSDFMDPAATAPFFEKCPFLHTR